MSRKSSNFKFHRKDRIGPTEKAIKVHEFIYTVE